VLFRLQVLSNFGDQGAKLPLLPAGIALDINQIVVEPDTNYDLTFGIQCSVVLDPSVTVFLWEVTQNGATFTTFRRGNSIWDYGNAITVTDDEDPYVQKQRYL
jgi:hypothetical protein